MTRRRWIAALALVATLAVATIAPPWSGAQSPSTLDQVRARGTLKVGWGVWFPYVYRDPKTRELQGLSVDILQDLARELGVKLEFVEEGWSTMIAGLQAGKFDLLNPIVNTPERARAADFSRPITKHGLGFVVPRKDLDKYRSWQDFDRPDKKIVVTLGASPDIFASRTFKHAQLVRVKGGQDEQVLQIVSGRADAQFTSVDSMIWIQREHQQLAMFRVPEFPPAEVAFALRQGDAALLTWVNGFIERQKAAGKLRRLIEKNGLDESFAAD